MLTLLSRQWCAVGEVLTGGNCEVGVISRYRVKGAHGKVGASGLRPLYNLYEKQ
jgi:hypothetical protein